MPGRNLILAPRVRTGMLDAILSCWRCLIERKIHMLWNLFTKPSSEFFPAPGNFIVMEIMLVINMMSNSPPMIPYDGMHKILKIVHSLNALASVEDWGI